MSELDNARYVSLTTYRRSGQPVATPVWITGSDGHYVVITGDRAGKVKRLRANPAVEVQACDMRGRVRPHSGIYRGTATVTTSGDDVRRAEQAVAEKYGWQYAVTRLADRARSAVARNSSTTGAVHLSLGAGPA